MTDLRTQLREDIAEALWGISKEHPEWSDCLNDPHTTAVLEALAPLLAVVEAIPTEERWWIYTDYDYGDQCIGCHNPMDRKNAAHAKDCWAMKLHGALQSIREQENKV